MDKDNYHQTEEIIQERLRLLSVLEAIPAFVYLQAPDYTIRFANRKFREMFEEPEDQPCYKVLHGETAPCEPCPTFRVFETHEQQMWEWTSPDKRIYMMYQSPISDIDGSELVLVMGIDITERRHAEESLKKAKNDLEKRVADRTIALAEANKSLQAVITGRKRMEKELREQTRQLRERVKELNCLFNISKVIEKRRISQTEMFQQIVDLLPPAWQYPDIACAKLVIENQMFITENFKETSWRLISPIIVNGKPNGRIEVYYLEERRTTEDSFLEEERELLNVIAERLAKIIERKRAEEALKIKTVNLKEANTALKVLLERREKDKAELEEKVLFNVKELVFPYLEKLKNGLTENQKHYTDIIESNLNEITSPFIRDLSPRLNLTPTEIHIANLVRQGKTTKEIADISNISSRTVEFHRGNLRKKLGIRHKSVNLKSYLLFMR